MTRAGWRRHPVFHQFLRFETPLWVFFSCLLIINLQNRYLKKKLKTPIFKTSLFQISTLKLGMYSHTLSSMLIQTDTQVQVLCFSLFIQRWEHMKQCFAACFIHGHPSRSKPLFNSCIVIPSMVEKTFFSHSLK